LFVTPLFVLEAIIGFSLLVFVHELGHFLAAKWMGIRVEAFSMGFGPCLKKRWGDTEYRLSLVPIGGYVKMAGEEPQPDKPPGPDEFYGKSVGRRAIVFVAGVVMNMIFGFVVLILAYQAGVPTIPPIVGDVSEGSPAWKAGLKRGDRIVAINDISPPVDFSDLLMAVALARRGKPVRLRIERDGVSFDQALVPEYSEQQGLQTVGIQGFDTMQVAEYSKADAKAALKEGLDIPAVLAAGLRPGDRITAVGVAGQQGPIPVGTLLEFAYAVERCGGKPIRIHFERNGVKQEPVTVTPQLVEPVRLGVGFGSNRLAAVREDSWAADAGLRAGDIISAVAEEEVRSRSEVLGTLRKAGDGPFSIWIIRDGVTREVSIPSLLDREEPEDVLAFEYGLSVNYTLPNSPAEKAGFQPGDKIIAAAGEKITNALELSKVIHAAKEDGFKITWLRGSRQMSAEVVPEKQWVVPIPWQRPQEILRLGFPDSCVLGARRAMRWVLRIYGTLRGLILGDISRRHLLGFVSIARLTYGAARSGIGSLLYVLGILSVNLGVLNLLPIPVLDGGHLLFSFLEKVRGRPVSERIRAVSSYAGLSLLIGIMLLALWNDIWAWISG